MVSMAVMPPAPSARAELLPTKVTNDEKGERGQRPRHERDEQAESPGHRYFRRLFLP